ncbi:MAG: hypothetical protein LC772_01995 [Chloroflexi bacterium]|nr:hypothetical protein [Chloroflexota bacterium]
MVIIEEDGGAREEIEARRDRWRAAGVIDAPLLPWYTEFNSEHCLSLVTHSMNRAECSVSVFARVSARRGATPGLSAAATPTFLTSLTNDRLKIPYANA